MNFLTDSLGFPQKEQRKCLSLAMATVGQGSGTAPDPSVRDRAATLLLRLVVLDVDHLALRGDDLVDDAVLLRLERAQVAVAVHVLRDPFDGLAGVMGQDLVEPLPRVEDLPRLDLDVGGRALAPARGLVDHDPRVRQRATLALGARCEEQRAHRGREPHAHRADRRAEVLHRVVDRQAGVHRAARRVDVHVDVLLGVFRLEEEELGDDDVRHIVVHGRAEEDDTVHEEAAEDVVAPLAPAGPLDHIGWINRHVGRSFSSLLPGLLPHPAAAGTHTIVDWAFRYSKTLSSVICSSRRASWPLFWSWAQTSPTGRPWRSAIASTRSSTSAEVACSPSISAIRPMTMDRRSARSATGRAISQAWARRSGSAPSGAPTICRTYWWTMESGTSNGFASMIWSRSR